MGEIYPTPHCFRRSRLCISFTRTIYRQSFYRTSLTTVGRRPINIRCKTTLFHAFLDHRFLSISLILFKSVISNP